MSLLDKIGPFNKAIVAMLVAFFGAGATAAVDEKISYAEWWIIASATVTALGAVYGVPNKDPKGERQDESVQPPGDHTDLDGDGHPDVLQ